MHLPRAFLIHFGNVKNSFERFLKLVSIEMKCRTRDGPHKACGSRADLASPIKEVTRELIVESASDTISHL